MRNHITGLVVSLLAVGAWGCGAGGDEASASNEGDGGSTTAVGKPGAKGKAGSGTAGASGAKSAVGAGGAASGKGGAAGSGASASGGASGAAGGAAGGAGSGVEACGDGFDNDGDGQVDEGCDCKAGVTEPCYPGPPSALAKGGACKAGQHSCIYGGELGNSWGPCAGAVLPSAEACDGIDNDCDGKIDNGPGCLCAPGDVVVCGLTTGVCKQGTQSCLPGGKLGPCTGGVSPAPELCDGLDNDCDGQIDESGGPDGGSCECVPGKMQPCGLMAGECKPGVQVCQAGGVWSDCVGAVPPGTEVCNGKDDDCDGVIDKPECECLDGAVKACGTGVGACKKGVISCVGGKLTACQGAVEPKKEVCGDNIDNDCDGTVDNGCPKVVEVTLNVSGDCTCAPACPKEAPYVVGCKVDFDGGNSNGCVAPAGNSIYFQEGVSCGAGHVSGKLICSSEKGGPLNASNCPINKSVPKWASKPSGCAKITSGSPGSCFF
jgi:hypothetical protein